MERKIWIDRAGLASTLDCSEYVTRADLRQFVSALRRSADRCGGERFYVVEGGTVRAASHKAANVRPYMTADRVFVHAE